MRTLARAPGFTAIALVVLSLGIGANATIFSFANAFFLRPLPSSIPASVVRVVLQSLFDDPAAELSRIPRPQLHLSGLAAFQLKSFGLLIDRETEHVFGEIVTMIILDRRNRTGARSPPAALRRYVQAHRPSSSFRTLSGRAGSEPRLTPSAKRSASMISRSR